jgi:molybdopterin synthase sulfur carrier subunit
MTVRLLYFAWVRERIGVSEEAVEMAESAPLSTLVARLAARSAAHAEALSQPELLRAAVNQALADWDVMVRPGDEVALFPPVTGG